MPSYKKQVRLSQDKEHLDEERPKIHFGTWSAEISSKAQAILSILHSVLGIGVTVFAVLAGKLLTGNTVLKRSQIDIWIPIAMGLAVAVVVMIFTFLLKREPSKVLHLRQKLTDIYLSGLTESMRKIDRANRS